MASVSGAMIATEENLGDLKLYRVPEQVTVSAQSLKQVSFLRRENVAGRLLYAAWCEPGVERGNPVATGMLLTTVNDDDHGLGVALPTGQVAMFEREMLVGEETIRDYASGQDVEIALGDSTQVFSQCERISTHDIDLLRWSQMQVTLTNANPAPAIVRVTMGSPGIWQLRGARTRLKDGQQIMEVMVPGNGTRVVNWDATRATN